MILGEKREIRDQSHIFFREHQVLEILASGPQFEYPPLVTQTMRSTVNGNTLLERTVTTYVHFHVTFGN